MLYDIVPFREEPRRIVCGTPNHHSIDARQVLLYLLSVRHTSICNDHKFRKVFFQLIYDVVP